MTAEMTEAEVDFETAVGDPAAFYPDPQAIVIDATISKAQKQRFLVEWAQDLSQRQVADGEGMAPDDSRSAAMDAVLLKQVNAAIVQLENQSESSPTTALRTLWTRLQKFAG